ncbi:serine-rich adhesin for platelets isoform X2 [Denticeps clupeoides]|uniref:serine-rich adhesin for platelets isoform X2 n=1 Tax=Denticeps clupeoides TaxID=299321 RepID=UPI0010A2DF29|nr:serine-rich adhesin for platelets-like isoform X2 [Denticeps clupeoides]
MDGGAAAPPCAKTGTGERAARVRLRRMATSRMYTGSTAGPQRLHVTPLMLSLLILLCLADSGYGQQPLPLTAVPDNSLRILTTLLSGILTTTTKTTNLSTDRETRTPLLMPVSSPNTLTTEAPFETNSMTNTEKTTMTSAFNNTSPTASFPENTLRTMIFNNLTTTMLSSSDNAASTAISDHITTTTTDFSVNSTNLSTSITTAPGVTNNTKGFEYTSTSTSSLPDNTTGFFNSIMTTSDISVNTTNTTALSTSITTARGDTNNTTGFEYNSTSTSSLLDNTTGFFNSIMTTSDISVNTTNTTALSTSITTARGDTNNTTGFEYNSTSTSSLLDNTTGFFNSIMTTSDISVNTTNTTDLSTSITTTSFTNNTTSFPINIITDFEYNSTTTASLPDNTATGLLNNITTPTTIDFSGNTTRTTNISTSTTTTGVTSNTSFSNSIATDFDYNSTRTASLPDNTTGFFNNITTTTIDFSGNTTSTTNFSTSTTTTPDFSNNTTNFPINIRTGFENNSTSNASLPDNTTTGFFNNITMTTTIDFSGNTTSTTNISTSTTNTSDFTNNTTNFPINIRTGFENNSTRTASLPDNTTTGFFNNITTTTIDVSGNTTSTTNISTSTTTTPDFTTNNTANFPLNVRKGFENNSTSNASLPDNTTTGFFNNITMKTTIDFSGNTTSTTNISNSTTNTSDFTNNTTNFPNNVTTSFEYNSTGTASLPENTTPGISIGTTNTTSFVNNRTGFIDVSTNTTNVPESTAKSFPYNTTLPSGSDEVQCDFLQVCGNQSDYYWMVLEVKVSGKNESYITDWLIQAFTDYLGMCPTDNEPLGFNKNSTMAPTQASPTNMTTNPASEGTNTLTSYSGTVTATTHTINVSENANESSSNIFQDIEVSCILTENISNTHCTVLLKVNRLGNPCCIQYALGKAAQSSTSASVVNNSVERLAKGVCNSTVPPSSGSVEKCSGSLTLPEACNPNTSSNNISCGNWSTVYVRVEDHNPVTCPIVFEVLNNSCDFLAYCNSTDAYYSIYVNITSSWINQSDIEEMVNNLTLYQNNRTSCSMSPPQCRNLEFISALLVDTHVVCEESANGLQGCIVVVKLQHAVNMCDIMMALHFVFDNQTTVSTNGVVQRIALFGGTAGLSGDVLYGNLTVDSLDLSSAGLCGLAPDTRNILSCPNEKILIVNLNDNCEPGPGPTQTTTHFTVVTMSPTTTLSNSTSLNTTQNSIQPWYPTSSNSSSEMTTPSTLINATAATPNVTVTTSVSSNTTMLTVASPNVTITTSVAANTTIPTGAPPNIIVTTHVAAYTTIPTAAPTTALTAFANSTGQTTMSNTDAEANALLDLTNDVSSLNSSQVDQLVSKLQALLSGPNVSLSLGTISVKIVSNLLNASASVLATSSSRLIGIVDTVGLKLVLQGSSQTIFSDSLALAVKKVDGAHFQQTSFTITNPSDIQISGSSKRKREVIEMIGRSSGSQGSITLPASLTENLSPQDQQTASRLQFNFYQKNTIFQDIALGDRQLNSGILSTSVANLSITSLRENVSITLKNQNPIPVNYSAYCVFWDFSFNDGSGGWNTNGCTVLNSTDEETICSCNHLTSFGVLLDISRQGIMSRLQDTILTFITYIGCGLSAIFLSVTLLTYLCFGKLRKDIPSKILIHLCMALLLLNLVFLLDAWLALYPDAVGLCISTAFFLHYFLLASFTWMALEAIHMYLALVKVFNVNISHFMLKFSFAGWGIPLVVVIIVIAISKDNYGLISYGKFSDGTTDEFCWLKNNIAFYVAVVAYFCVVFLLNFCMFIVVMVQLWRIKRANPQNVQHRSTLQDARSVAGLTVLLGLTWGFAFFAWGPVNIPFMYLFAIFNSFQGFFIFVFHCAAKENVRRQWRIYLCCGKLRLAENSDWSRTVTQKTMKKSSVNGSTSFHSSNSSHSQNSILLSDVSERHNGICSPFDDQMITAREERTTDVVINEINSQYRNQISY